MKLVMQGMMLPKTHWAVESRYTHTHGLLRSRHEIQLPHSSLFAPDMKRHMHCTGRAQRDAMVLASCRFAFEIPITF